MELERNRYIIAGIKTEMVLRKSGRIALQARDYLCDFEGEPEIITGVSDEFIDEKIKETPLLSRDECEYMWTGTVFCNRLWSFDSLMLHSSAVVYEGKAYLFSAPSGTGKSTHTGLWKEVFGDKAYILNDDKPVIRIEGDRVMVYGTPWSGKTDLNRNIGVPLQGICFLERAKDNYIKELAPKEAVFGILNQTVRPYLSADMDRLFAMIDKILARTGVFKMGCNISTQAVRTAYEGMNPKKGEE